MRFLLGITMKFTPSQVASHIQVMVFTASLTLLGCTDSRPQINNVYPMVSWENKEKLVLLATYDRAPVIHEVTSIKDRRAHTEQKQVYLNYRSQLVFRDGTALTDKNGYIVYWERKGRFVNSQGRQVFETDLFVKGNKRMERHTAIMVLDDYEQAKAEYERQQING